MADNKKAFVMYCDNIHMFELLTDIQAGKLIKIIMKYVNDQNPVVKDPVLKIAFEPIKQQLKRDLTIWESERTKRSEAGRKGGLVTQSRRKQNEAPLKDTKANQGDNVNVSVNVSDSVKVNDIKKERVKRFTPPAPSDVFIFMREKGLPEDQLLTQSQKFIDHYTSNGWMVGKNKMKDWRAAVRSNWLKDISSNGQYPNYYNNKFEKTLAGNDIMKYHNHLIGLGWQKVHPQSGGTVWNKPKT